MPQTNHHKQDTAGEWTLRRYLVQFLKIAIHERSHLKCIHLFLLQYKIAKFSGSQMYSHLHQKRTRKNGMGPLSPLIFRYRLIPQ